MAFKKFLTTTMYDEFEEEIYCETALFGPREASRMQDGDAYIPGIGVVHGANTEKEALITQYNLAEWGWKTPIDTEIVTRKGHKFIKECYTFKGGWAEKDNEEEMKIRLLFHLQHFRHGSDEMLSSEAINPEEFVKKTNSAILDLEKWFNSVQYVDYPSEERIVNLLHAAEKLKMDIVYCPFTIHRRFISGEEVSQVMVACISIA